MVQPSAWVKYSCGQRAYYHNSVTRACSLQLPAEGVMREGEVPEAEAQLFEKNWVIAGKMDELQGLCKMDELPTRRSRAALPISAECGACHGKHMAHICERACPSKRKPLAGVDNNGAKRRSTLVLKRERKTGPPPPRESSAAPAKDEVLVGLLERVINQLKNVRGEMDTLKLENARLADRVAALEQERHEEHEQEEEENEEENDDKSETKEDEAAGEGDATTAAV